MGDLIDAASAALSFIGTQQTNQAAADRQAAANQFSAQQFATRYQTTVKDLEAAGLNPMLAYGATPVAPTSTAPAPVQNALGSAVESYQKSKATNAQSALQNEQVKQVASQVNLNSSQVNLNSANTAKANAEAEVAKEQAELIRRQQPKTVQEEKTSKSMMQSFMAQAGASAAQAKHYGSLIDNLAQSNKVLQQEIIKLQQSNDQNKPESEIAKKYPTFYYIFHSLMPTLSGSVPNLPRVTNVYK